MLIQQPLGRLALVSLRVDWPLKAGNISPWLGEEVTIRIQLIPNVIRSKQ